VSVPARNSIILLSKPGAVTFSLTFAGNELEKLKLPIESVEVARSKSISKMVANGIGDLVSSDFTKPDRP
jgi:hypothetical protein